MTTKWREMPKYKQLEKGYWPREGDNYHDSECEMYSEACGCDSRKTLSDALRDRIATLVKYAQHPMDCGFTDHGERDPSDCTCGLTEAMERLKKEGLA